MRECLLWTKRHYRHFIRSQSDQIRRKKKISWIFCLIIHFFYSVCVFLFLDGPLLLITWHVWNVALLWQIVSLLWMLRACVRGTVERECDTRKRVSASIWKEYERWKLNNKSFEWQTRSEKKNLFWYPFLKFLFSPSLDSFLSRSVACDAIVSTDSYSSDLILSLSLSVTIFRHSSST